MSDSQTVRAEPAEHTRSRRKWLRLAVVFAIMLLLFGVPWWTLLSAGTRWPTAVVVIGSARVRRGFVALPVMMMLRARPLAPGLGGRNRPTPCWVPSGCCSSGRCWPRCYGWRCSCSVSRIRRGPVSWPARSSPSSSGCSVWGYAEAMRVPRIRHVEVTIPGLGSGLDGLRVAMITDTHFGPIDRSRWSAAVVDRVNELDADIVCHVGDIADGTVEVRGDQAQPLAAARGKLARVYVTGNHEYFSEAQGWLDYMDSIGWDALHNRHIVVERGGDELVVAGVDDATAQGSGVEGHGANLEAALADADPTLPVLLLAHQPKQVTQAVSAGVDLQISGHTHGGQIWPFNFLVRLDQPVVQGLSRHGDRTQLYTSRGTGFWGPPFRVFAPSEITALTLRRGESDSP